MSAVITGDKEIDRALENLEKKGARKVMRNGVSKGLRVIVKGIKSEVPSQYKDAKKAIGGSFKKAKGGDANGQIQAKAGAAVGMKLKTLKTREAKQKDKRAKAGKSKGSVGLGALNIHWAILGTKKRTRTKIGGFLKDSRGDKTTGKMPPILGQVVIDGFNKSEGAALAVITSTLRDGIEQEAKA